MAHWRPVDLEVKQRGRVRGGRGGGRLQLYLVIVN